jgi:predicted transcriptional regulator
VSSPRLEIIVKHDGRLNLLCCLQDAGPLSVPQLAARVGESAQAVRYWVNLLDSFGLVEKCDELSDGEPLYAASLDDHPEWVHEAVRRHRPRSL